MDDVVSATVITCSICRHGLQANASGGDRLLHTPCNCGFRCCQGKPRCFSCREPFCTCPAH
jgi:hypothetical protein